MITIKTFVFNPFQVNTYILYDETLQCAVIDAACSTKAEQDELISFIEEKKLDVKLLLNTHGHVDHVLGNKAISERFGLPVQGHSLDLFMVRNSQQMGAIFGLKSEPQPDTSIFINDLDILHFGNSELKVLHVPGHSPGSLVFYCERDAFVISGDVLFRDSIGRTDLPGGDFQSLVDGINQKLFTLPDHVKVYSGHGPTTEIGYEKTNNPYI
jgi:hydroxyacylglutathione hydrolase